jgi:hypothetical protein
MTNTAGFYKFTANELRYAPTSVHAPNFTLIAADHASYTYPVEGWRYFDSYEAAESYFGLNGASNTDWPGFRQAILTENGYLAAMARARDSQDDAAWAAVTFSLSRLDRFQDKGDFAEYLQGLVLIVSVQPEQEKGPLIQEFLDLAVRCNLPTAFITALNEAIIAMTPPSA